MRKATSKTTKTGKSRNPHRVEWDNLVVAKSDSLPKGVLLLFVSAARSITSAANSKAATIGIPGGVTVLRQYPLNKATGKRLFTEMKKSLKRFPDGNCDGFFRTSISTIARKYSQLSSQDPNQIELRKILLEQQITEQSKLLEDIKKGHNDLKSKISTQTSELDVLEQKKLSLVDQIGDLEWQYETKNDQLGELVDHLLDKEMLKEKMNNEVDELKIRIRDLQEQYSESEISSEVERQSYVEKWDQ